MHDTPDTHQCQRWLKTAVKPLAIGLLLIGLLGLYAWRMQHCTTFGHHEPDCDGYLLMAHRFAQGQLARFPQPDYYRYQEHLWVTNRHGDAVPKFAPGYPLLAAVGHRLAGPTGFYLTSPILGGLALAGLFALFRQQVGGWWALAATGYLVGHPTVLFYLGYPLTHAADMCFTLWGFALLFAWLRRNHAAAAAGAGICLGFAVTIRHANALFLAPAAVVGLAVTLTALRRLDKPIRPGVALRQCLPLIAFGCAYAIPIAALMAYNQAEFGHVFRTGYALSRESTGFSFAGLARNGLPLVHSLAVVIVPFLMPLAVLGVVTGLRPLARSVTLLWCLPLTLLMGSYYWFRPEPTFSRVLLAVAPAFMLLAFGVLRLAFRRPCQEITAALLAMLLGAFLHGVATERNPDPKRLLNPCRQGGATAAWDTVERVNEHCPPGALLFADDHLSHTVFAVRDYDVYRTSAFFDPAGILRMMRGGDGIRTQPERIEAATAFYDARDDAERERDLLARLDAAGDADQPVFLLVGANEIERRWRPLLGEAYVLQTRDEWRVRQRYRRPYRVGLWQIEPAPTREDETTP